MLRGFFLIFLLAGIVIVAMCGFRGEHGTRTALGNFSRYGAATKSPGTSAARFFR